MQLYFPCFQGVPGLSCDFRRSPCYNIIRVEQHNDTPTPLTGQQIIDPMTRFAGPSPSSGAMCRRVTPVGVF